MQCAPSTDPGTAGNVCSFVAHYGNGTSKPIEVAPGTTGVVDQSGQHFVPVISSADDAPDGAGAPAVGVDPAAAGLLGGPVASESAAAPAAAYFVAPGGQKVVAWSVTLPAGTKPATVQWNGSTVHVAVRTVAPAPGTSVTGAATATAAVPTRTEPPTAPTTPAPTTPAPTTTKPTTPAPTTTKPTTPKPTLPKPTTRPPVPVVHRPPAPHHPVTPTTNPTNPGGGVGGIG